MDPRAWGAALEGIETLARSWGLGYHCGLGGGKGRCAPLDWVEGDGGMGDRGKAGQVYDH